MKRLPRSFYVRPTLEVAEDLLGKVLVHRAPEGTTSGKIVEVEAYIGEEDPACHAAPGPTARNEPLYGIPGFAYVYLNYGVHFLFNVVTEPRGNPAAVLVRALEPMDGIELMRKRRATRANGRRPLDAARSKGKASLADADLCRGPGNVTQAMGIMLADNRTDLCGTRLFIEDRGLEAGDIAWSPRIGISVGMEHAWRAYVAASPAVSGRKSTRSTA